MAIKKYFVIFAFFFWASANLDAALFASIDYTNYADGITDTTGVDILKDRFDHADLGLDPDANRGRSVRFNIRQSFIKLNNDELQAVILSDDKKKVRPCFLNPYGFSHIYGWMLSKFQDAEPKLLSYLGDYYSLNKFFLDMITKMPAVVQPVLKRAWFAASQQVEANRNAFFGEIIYLPYAIKKVKERSVVADGTDSSMEVMIKRAWASPKAGLAFYQKDLAAFWSVVAPMIVPDLSTINIEDTFTKVMGWAISHYDLTSPVFAKINDVNFDIATFVEFIIDHVPSLHNAAEGQTDATNRSVINTRSDQLAIFAKKILDALVKQYGVDGAKGFVKCRIKDILRAFKVPGVVPRANLVKIEAVFDNAFVTSAQNVLRKIPTGVLNAEAFALVDGGPASPGKVVAGVAAEVLKAGATTAWAGIAPLTEARSALSKLEYWGVYITPIDWRVNDGVINRMNRYQLADILKTWDTYLDKVKRFTEPGAADHLKGPEVGNIMRHTYLSEVRALRHRLLDPADQTAETAGRLSINNWKDKFYNSFKTNGCRQR